MIGELYIGGAGLARGYLNRPELTAERFVPNLFATESDIANGYTRLYKTGDLVRWLSDGNIEYIGRNDFQVKIRGHRIELGEIENQLAKLVGIKQSIVLAQTNKQINSQYLVGYFVATELNTLSQEDLLTQLSTVLPDYMLPSILVELESLPLTVNGKLDRKALPNPEFVNEDTFVAPTSELEISLCNIFTDVLGLKMVGITDDFFRIGGNSILAIKLANILSKSLDTNVSVADIFTYKSISKLSAYITDNEIEHIVIPRLDLEQRELSFAQERLWFIEQYEGGSNAYHIPMLVSINDDINLDAIKQSISSVVQRHQVLRSVFKIDEEGNDYQVVLNDELVINEYSYQNTDISKQVDLDINTPFDLISNYPIRVSIYKEEDDTKLLINIHHIASDGWSTDILLKELNAYYDHYANNAPLELSSLSIQYKDFAVWQRGYLHGEELDKQLGYWQDRLIGYETLNLPTDYPRPAKIDYSGDNVSFEIDKDTSDKLRAIAKNNNTSLYSLMLSGFYVLLHKYSSQEDIVIGTPIANRHHTQTQDLIGFFVNSLGLREQLDTNKNIVELLNKVHNNLIEAQSHQDLPFERLVTALNVEQDQSRHPIFQVMFGLQSFGSENNSLFKSVTASTNYKIAKFDLECFIDDGQCNLQGSFNYATALYKKETVERLVESYQRVLNQLTENQETRVKDYSLLSSQDYQTIVYDWNKTTKLYPKDKTIYQLFQEQVDKNPNNIALVFEEEELTYKELNNKANQLARYIRSQYKEITNQELQADTLIPLCLERSLDMVVGILAVMKAGGAYVPMDPGYPAERFKHILTDTDANLIITQSHLITKLIPVTSIELIEIDEQDNLFIYENEEASNLIQHSQATDLAYVIYTSGTTGLPKGVLQTHGNVYRLLSSTDHQFGFNSNDIWTLYHSYIFDFSIWELWGSLTYGAKLVIPTQELVKDISSFVELCSEYKVTVLNQTPSAFYAFIDQLDSSGLNSLRYVIFGGDTLNINLLNRWWDYKKSNNLQTKLVNMYGITETTVHVTYKEIEQDEIASSNIGKPIDDLNSYILDQHNQPVPIGVIGELYIGGAGLARGYLNQPELTVERFISNPFATESDIANGYTRLYKTGDLVRWLSDGNIEYIGRNDFQVKIRGHRIELGEIENQLAKLVGIKQSIVLAQTNKQINSQYLVGYFVATELNTLSQEDLLTQLSTVLPDYMLPSILVELESLPLTVNGKLDRKALPNPEFVNEDTFVAPASELEISLCNIFTDVLGLEKVGITDDFFRIGGDSIVSIQLSSRLRKNGFAVSVRDIFDNRSVAKLATHIESNVKQEVAVLREEGVLTGSIRLLPIQEWFFDNIYSGKFVDFNHWNQSFMVKVPELDLQKIEDIIVKLINHHDILRVSYSIESNTQNHNQEIAIPKIKRLDINDYNNDELHNELTVWQSDFDIENGPLWSIGYLSGYADGSARLYFALHHLIVDAVSWRILIEDFKFIYNNEVLAPKATSYRQYSNLVTEYADNHNEQLVYWSNVLERVPTYPEISSKPTLGEVRLNKTQTEILLQQSSKAYHSEINDLLLVALALALQDWNGSARQGITLEGHGREHLVDAQDIGNTVGWFTTMYPVLLETQDDIGNTIKYIKESLRAIPDKGIGFGSFAINKDNDINFDQLPAISFNYLGQFDSKEGLWQLASEDSGISVSSKNQDHNIININGMVVDGQLSFSVVTQLGQDVTDKLSQSLQQSLIAIQEHTSELVEQGITYKTPSDYNADISIELLSKLQRADNEIEHIYPANSLQQGFIYHVLVNPNDDAYRVQLVFDYKQELNVENYVKAWELAIVKHLILRTAFNWEENIIQVIYSKGDLEYHLHDISNEENKEQSIKELQLTDRQQRFDLSKPTQLRLHIIKQSEEHYTIIKSEHHSISDGWSGPILLNDVHSNYHDLSFGNTPLVIVDDSYVRVQDYIQSQKRQAQEYWQDKLQEVTANDLSVLLSTDKNINDIKELEGNYTQSLIIEDKIYKKIKNITISLGITTNTLLQFVWHKLINIYTQDQQTIVGTTVSGRDIAVDGIEDSVGLYINTLPLIVDWNNDNTVKEQLEYLHSQITELSNYSYANLAQLQNSGERLFHSLFVFENYPVPSISKESDEYTLQPELRYAVEKLDYPLGVVAYEHNNSLHIGLKSSEEIISKQQSQEHLNKLQLILEQISEDVEQKHNKLTTLTKEDYQTIVYDWNKTDKDYPKDKTIYELFQEQVDKNPNNIALVFEEEELTYKELNNKANQLARYIRSQYKEITNQELQADTLIPLCLERSLDMVVGILAVMKAGGAYVPMDPGYPAERFKHILTDTDANLIITQSHLITKLIPVTSIELIEIDEQDNLFIYENEEASNLIQHSQATDLAYVIYTSGTTGLPKGVMLTYFNLNNLIFNQIQKFEFNKIFKVLQFASYTFDASVWEIFISLSSGYSLTLFDKKYRSDISYLSKLIVDKGIGITLLPPVIIEQLPKSVFEQLYILVTGGDKLSQDVISNSFGRVKLINAYGPTEYTVCATTHEYKNADLNTNIGKPLDNVQIYILDQYSQPVSIGVIGELYIGGAGLARGYLNQPELTVERFISNPFATESDIANGYTRLYKTGDLVRWLSDGNIEYIGRNDFQVKIRGHRIELGEIENQLAKLVGIKQSIVLAQTNKQINSQYLVGYFVATELNTLSQEDLLTQLSTVLPDYMLPSILVELESLPLTVNGKLDRKALPNPEFVNEDTFVAPASELEISLCNIFTDVLGLEKVGITDDFFRIGGDSIVSIQLSSRLRKNGFAVSVRDIFDNRSVAKLATHIESNVKQEVAVLREEGVLTGSIRLLPIQEWFFDNIYSGKFVDFNHWNQSFMVKVPELDLQKIEDIIVKLINHHDILRVSYSIESNTQNHNQEIAIPKIKRLDINDYNNDELHNELTVWQSDFDIENGPLWSIGYLSGYADGSARLYFALHHLIVDAVSWRILIEDFKFIYNNEVLAPKATSYRQYSNLVTEYADNHNEQLVYWSNVLERVPTYPEISSKPTLGEVRLNKTQTEILLQQSSKAYHSEINDLLLVALALALQDWNGSARQGITLEGHGREHLVDAQDIGNTVGWFTTMYPVLLETQDDIGNTIKYIKESLRAIPDKGIGFGSFAINKDNDINFDQLPAISFNYLGQFDSKEGLWQLASEDSGISVSSKNQDHNIININGMVVDGQLSFSVVTQLGQDVTDKLSQSLQQSLIAIQEHTSELVEQGITYKTPSDYNDFIPYEIINPEINEDPIFIFPPANGGAESYYNNLVPKLKNKKLVLFNNYMFYLKNNNIKAYRDITYEDLAKIYVLYIKQIQGGGVHYLFGWSFGGVLAFEVAKCLFKINRNVGRVVLLDSFFDFYKEIKYIDSLSRIIRNDDINMKYKTPQNIDVVNFDLFLIKCLDHNKLYNSPVTKHYLKNVDNNIFNYIKTTKKISIIPVEASHETCLYNERTIMIIVALLNTLK